MIDRKCIEGKEYCHLSEKSTPCTRDQMYWHVAKIPLQRLLGIVIKYNLARFPDVLNKRTLANLVVDHTVENIADELMGENQ